MSHLVETKQAVVRDSLCLVAITFLSAAPYVSRLGFYSDDWDILSRFDAAATQHRWPLGEIVQVFPGRPLQGTYAALLYQAFGRNPLGYHLVNTTVLALSLVLFYLLLERLRMGRGKALAAGLIFVILPQLSTIRVWFAAFQVTLSLFLTLASLHGQLSFARSGKLAWGAIALLAGLLGVAAYEIFAPLLAGFAIALVVVASRNRGMPGWRPLAASAAVTALLALVLIFKLATSARAGPLTQWDRYANGAWQFFRTDYDWRVDSSLNIFAALDIYFWRVVGGWGSAAVGLAASPSTVVAASAAAAVIAFWRMQATATPEECSQVGPLLLLGLATFVFGHALFLIVPAIVFTPTGMGNRVLVAAAVGVAMIFGAAIAIAARGIFHGRARTAFALITSVVLFLGILRLNTIELYWAEAPAMQRVVLESAHRDLAFVPAGSTVILDGACPYHGPAVVFESSWDIGPALSFALNRQLNGDVVSPRMAIDADGIRTSIYKQLRFYPYGPRLYAYDVRRHLVAALPNQRAAAAYVARRPPLHCPAGYVARGVPV